MDLLLASLLALVGLTADQESTPTQTHVIDPASPIYSRSSVSKDLIDLEPVPRVRQSDFLLRQDEWRQMEFFPASRLAEIQSILTELAKFEAGHRKGDGVSEIFVRNVRAGVVLSSEDFDKTLAKTVKSKFREAPILLNGSQSPKGRLINGFTLPLGGGNYLYGARSEKGVSMLSANFGANDSWPVRIAFVRLHKRYNMIAVDWDLHNIWLDGTPDGLLTIRQIRPD